MKEVERFGFYVIQEGVTDAKTEFVRASDYDDLQAECAALVNGDEYQAMQRTLAEVNSRCESLQSQLAEALKDAERLKRGLKFYADGCHFSADGETDTWETVSGEPQNFWCDEAGTTIEDGGIAKQFLQGWDFDDDPDSERMIPPDAAKHEEQT